MKIAFVEVQNFRRLKSCRLEFGDKETVLVGANNSGKTSAMDALILFLSKDVRKGFLTTDFTLSNWNALNQIATRWVVSENSEEQDLDVRQFYDFLPAMDVWLEVSDREIHRVSHLIPKLSWAGGKIGVRLLFEPKTTSGKMDELYKDFTLAFQSAQQLMGLSGSKPKRSVKKTRPAKQLALWPRDFRDFLQKGNLLHKHFELRPYLLDPDKLEIPDDRGANPQPLPTGSEPLEVDPFKGLFNIHVIHAQRGFSDNKYGHSDEVEGRTSLSGQLRSYCNDHLNPSETPEPTDLAALTSMEAARTEFDKRLKETFRDSIAELETIGYPGSYNPSIEITAKLDPIQSLNHESAVQYYITKGGNNEVSMALPERYNGLGYQNLISIFFKLIRFRDEWLRTGKAAKQASIDEPEPLHLVLIEEPEAFLHAQVQQVFIKKAFGILSKAPSADPDENRQTQLVVSTHSSHIAHSIDFTKLRYFKRSAAADEGSSELPLSSIINLTDTFGDEVDSERFAIRYLRITHSDLFFADGAILVEGAAERILMPMLLKNHFQALESVYLSMMEIGGRHAHRLRPLLERLGIPVLIVTDLDAIESDTAKKCKPVKNAGLRTGNPTLKSWLPGIESLDQLIACPAKKKSASRARIRVAYQCAVTPGHGRRKGKGGECIPYTFEDALVLENFAYFQSLKGETGLLAKIIKIAQEAISPSESQDGLIAAVQEGAKAEFALDLLLQDNLEKLATPAYIAEGLEWLETNLSAIASPAEPISK